MSEANKIVNENIEEYKKYNSFLIQGSKTVTEKDDNKQYNVGVHLQIFTDEKGKPVMIREVI